jgi:serine/threonine-protein kinase HipA
MARQCGLDIPETKYFDLTPKLAGFGIERFDRRHRMRVPTLSLAALLDDNFRLPTRDYEVFLRATRTLTKDDRQVKMLSSDAYSMSFSITAMITRRISPTL